MNTLKSSNSDSENAITFHSNLSGSFRNNYNNFLRFKERKLLFLNKANHYIPKNGSILDLGCGPGIIATALADNGYVVTGIDGSEEMIQIALSESKHFETLKFYRKSIPFESFELNQKFDSVISSSLLEYLEEYDKTILLIRELLNQNGVFIASVPNFSCWYRKIEKIIFFLTGKPTYFKFVKNKHNKEDFIKSITSAGFECLEFEYFAPKGRIFRFLAKFLPPRLTKNMLICTFRKI